jgi:NNP family nitrate/nitrite transporter-like MFS transporter
MIPVIFLTRASALRGNDEAPRVQAIKEGNTEGAAAVGFTGAMAPTAASSSPRATAAPSLPPAAPSRAVDLHRLLRMCVS